MRKRLLALLRVPERPEPPPGAGAELETFRAERGFLHYTVLMWFPKQIAALAGLLFSLAFFGGIAGTNLDFISAKGLDAFVDKVGGIDFVVGPFELGLDKAVLFFEVFAIVAWVSQLLFTGLLLKLSWELRWYMVGERSLRIRQGLWSVREQTMTIANIQNMIVRQGPIQRLFGISDLEVHTAGGGATGSSGEDPTQQKDSFHVGRFRGIANASALRDKIRERLLAVTSGKGVGRGHQGMVSPSSDLEPAALALLAEARALRRAAVA